MRENGEVRGITILYDQAMEGTMDPLVAPMSSAFVPFATGFAVAGAADAAAPQGRIRHRRVRLGGRAMSLTDRQLIDGCNVIALPGLGNAERVATDASGELALLRVYGARNLTPIGMIGGAPGGAERHAGRRRRSAGAGRRRGDLGGQRQARHRGRDEPARNRAGAGILRRRRARRARAASPAWW